MRTVFSKILLFLALGLTMTTFTSCGGSDEPEPKETTYTFKDKLTGAPGVTVEIILFEYNNSGDVVGQQSFTTTKGLERVFTANKNAKKVKANVTMASVYSSETNWFLQVYYLEKGKNIDIVMTDDTMLSDREP